MAKKEKTAKTNAMRILEKNKIPFTVNTYDCQEFIDGVHIADFLHQPCTAIGMKKQYDTVLHESALQFDQIIVSGGKLGTQILIAPSDFLKVTKGKSADIIVS